MVDANNTLDSRRIARDQESRIAATAVIGLTAIKPMIEFQVAMFRMYGEFCELMARNCEKSLESFGSAIDHPSVKPQ